MTASGDRRFVPPDLLNWNDSGGEVAVFDAASQHYFALNASAAAIWREFVTGRSVDETIDALAQRFDIPRAGIAGDVEAFVVHALERGLLAPAG